MANVCCTTYNFENTRHDSDCTKKLYDLIMSVWNKKTCEVWIGDVLKAAGLDPEGFHCRGNIVYAELSVVESGASGELIIDCDDAWYPQYEAFEALMRLPEFYDMTYSFHAEEPGCDVYVTNDPYYRFLYDDGECYEFLDSQREALEFVNRKFKNEFKSVDEFNTWYADNMECEYTCWPLHEYEMV